MQLRSLAAALGASVLVFSANTAFAVDEPVAPPAEAAVSVGLDLVPVLGTGITLSIGTDATGHLTTVKLTSYGTDDAPVGAAATEVSPHEVEFVVGDGSTKVEVKTKGTSVKTEVETSALDNLVGRHTWSGALFGGEPTIITFTIGGAGGVPSISDVVVSGPGAPSSIPPATITTDDDESEAKLRIEFRDDSGHEARVTIKVEVEDEDGQPHAELKISARSDLFAVEEAVGPVADPVVNPPMSEQAHDDDDHDEDHDSDHDDDEDHDDDRDDDHDEDHDDDRDDDHDDDRDEDHDDDHDDDDD